jgi:hypothetical protein
MQMRTRDIRDLTTSAQYPKLPTLLGDQQQHKFRLANPHMPPPSSDPMWLTSLRKSWQVE